MSIDKPAFKGDDYDFAAGSVKGLRSWNMDAKGRLRGVTHTAVWLPGENVAVCRVRPECPTSPMRDADPFSIRYYSEPTLGPRALIKPCDTKGCDGNYHPAPHTFDPSCECGFWAYDEANFSAHGDVVGVIEGYGKTTIGTKGFRCEKARIVALSRELESGDILGLSKWLRLKALYPEARFYVEYDEMITAHGQVLKTWDAIDDDFWVEESAPSSEFGPMRAQLRRLQAQMASTYTYSPAPARWRIGGAL